MRTETTSSVCDAKRLEAGQSVELGEHAQACHDGRYTAITNELALFVQRMEQVKAEDVTVHSAIEQMKHILCKYMGNVG
ncbi:hypothetical protein MH117_16345 [Paenibacillus sp. ACRRX]|uniref:hypothetical protein n=1 Tax=unclassified Paenibacillus TaxID=185978 RepID=UPI001EF55B9B|nr:MULTISPECIES: hypothetical protein [unclassified Paenibacillus]MCG7408988.1 hypothetical protein [Paenibacillus sp. ACRRX]MDK8182013.1 hypothetical protein [Paenibacillus sp. UMB4589-SE434]